MKPEIPKGTRDFSSTQVARRNYIFNTIKHSFELFGFQPIETPSFENSDTLMGKYGEEGDRLIFKILNSGDYMKVNSKYGIEINNFIVEIYRNLIGRIKNDTKSNIEKNFELIVRQYKYVFKSINDFGAELIFNELNKSDRRKRIIDKIIEFNSNPNLREDNFEHYFSVLKRSSISKISNYILSALYKNSKFLSSELSEKALRYDLTVPFARYVVQHQNEITFPFKRYQIQPVWRADKPQKGRYREFYQCDADVVGSKSLWQEVEFVQLYDGVFSKLNIKGTTIKINNRKILSGIAEVIGAKDKLIDFTVALDKLDKIGKDGVTAEMISKGISEEAINKVQPLFDFTGTNTDKLNSLKTMLATSEEGMRGVKELEFVISNIEKLGLKTAILELDVTLARGLNYYTGAIFEVAAPKEVKLGSIGGGGRYDDLTGIFGLKDVSGVGISFGLDRIYLVMEELGLFETVELPKPKVLFLNFNEEQSLQKVQAIAELRANGIKSELYPDVAKSNNQQKKQWKYVDKRAIEYVVTDVEGDKFMFKNCETREQNLLTISEIIKKIE
ncbi:histidine--tRNA ligase [Tenacibaculum sp. M341]|uniref:histidine--tRNA ligase n=1 Tax=Tenacibaculum sp. M341 TaxID=2530339 RepID=UPI00104E8F50|nr:histidine--tRNA ligase [Tenacibaculum sp. M341]TCI91882.1 histidine--tRNA ligase [Tenacibaculum sp. M341]